MFGDTDVREFRFPFQNYIVVSGVRYVHFGFVARSHKTQFAWADGRTGEWTDKCSVYDLFRDETMKKRKHMISNRDQCCASSSRSKRIKTARNYLNFLQNFLLILSNVSNFTIFYEIRSD